MNVFRTFTCEAVVIFFSVCQAESSVSNNFEKYFFDIEFVVSIKKNFQDLSTLKHLNIVDFFIKNGINKNDIHFNRVTALQNKKNLIDPESVEMIRIESNNLELLKLSLDKFKSFASDSYTKISDIKKKKKAVI